MMKLVNEQSLNIETHVMDAMETIALRHPS